MKNTIRGAVALLRDRRIGRYGQSNVTVYGLLDSGIGT
jgi:hypothetical protein